MKEHIKWLLKELPILETRNVIDSSSADALREYYREKEDSISAAKAMRVLLRTFGIAMFFAGIILLLSWKWDSFPRLVRVGITFIPLLAALFAGTPLLLKRGPSSAVYDEGTALLAALGVALPSGMIARIYNVDFSLLEYLRLTMLLGAPLIYLFRSSFLAGLYCFGFVLMCMNTDYHGPSLGTDSYMLLFYVLPALPFLLYHFRCHSTSLRTIFMRYIVFLLLVPLMFAFNRNSLYLPLFAGAGLMFVSGLLLNIQGIPMLRNPWLPSGYFFMTVLSALTAMKNNWFSVDFHLLAYGGSAAILLGLFYAIIAYCLYLDRKSAGWEKYTVLLFLCLPLTHYTRIAGSLFLVLSGVVLIVSALKRKDRIGFNAGVLQLLVIFFCRLFDSDLSLLFRAAAFLLAGILLIAGNSAVSRYFYRKALHE